MSGHSKWHNIQKKKGAADARRGQLFTKLAKAITVAAKDGGGGDPDFNFQLRVAIDAAKAANMPKENIERSIKRGTGEATDGSQIEEVLYEGFGPGGAAMIIQCFTDNRNRAIGDVRTTMSKRGGNLGGQGSVMWMFDKKGVVVIKQDFVGLDQDAFDMEMIEAGAEDIDRFEDVIQITTSVVDLKHVLDALSSHSIIPEAAGLEFVAKDPVIVSGEDKESLDTLTEALDELDDVDAVFTNEG